MSTLATLFIASLAVSARALESGAVLDGLTSAFGNLSGLRARQTTLDPDDIPAACSSACNLIFSSLNTCPGIDCICTSANADSMEACVNCLVTLAPVPAMINQGEELLQDFDDTCASFNLPPLSLTAGGSSATGSSSGSSTSFVISGFASATVGGTATGTSIFPQSTSTTGGGSSLDDDDSTDQTSDVDSDNPFSGLDDNGAKSVGWSSVAAMGAVIAGAAMVI